MREIDLDEFVKICENHQHFLNGDCENWKDLRMCLMNCLIKDIEYSEINLDLSNAYMDNVEFDSVAFYSINLQGAFLRHCNIHDSRLTRVDFMLADMCDCVIKSSYIDHCNFDKSELIDVDFKGSSFQNCTFHEANLIGSKNVPFIPTTCPEEGSFIGWKKCIQDICEGKIHNFCLVKLEILADAKRSSATGRKCRCSKAKVLSIETFDGKPLDIAYSQHDISFTYRVGDIVSVDNFDEDRFKECASGIHFFINKQEAIDYVL